MRPWLEPHAIAVPEELTASVGGHPLVAQTLARRGFATSAAARAFIAPGYFTPSLPDDLPGMSAAAERVARAIRQREPICVWGDFDVDGQTSTTVLVQTLRELGADVSFHIPVRERESHGVNLPVLEQVIAAGARLILTCDTGIAAHDAVDFARSKGVDFVITDHHDLPPTLPDAEAVVNPKLLPSSHSLSTLPGVGVAYKLAEALCNLLHPVHFQPSTLHDLAALGIVADVAIQTGEARYLVQRGLEALRRAERVGLKAVMEAAELNPAWLTETHIGFVLGPRLNALGRLSDANVSVELLTTQDVGRARVIAASLEGLNAQRQLLTSQVFQAAQSQIERDPALIEAPALVLANPAWPAGVIGIVASRLVERYHRPVVLIANPPGRAARGSARSIEGVNITAAIAEQRDLLLNFGGHPMAAGLSLDAERIPDFRRGLARSVERMAGNVQAESALQVDGYVALPELSLELVEDLGRLAPFGPGNPPLVLAARNIVLKSHATIGRGNEHLQLIVEDESGNTRKVLWWQGAGYPLPQGRFDLAFTVHASDYRGQRDVQVEFVDARLLEAPVEAAAPPAIEVVDYRQQPQPAAVLQRLAAEGDSQVWCEADATAKLAAMGIAGSQRQALSPARALAIWTTPPGPGELRAAIERVSPQVIYVFGVDPEATGVEPFLKRLAGLVKYALNAQQGRVSLTGLAAATGQLEASVRLGLQWLAGRGHVTIVSEKEGALELAGGTRSSESDLDAVAAQLAALLAEVAAYRAYFHKSDLTGFKNL